MCVKMEKTRLENNRGALGWFKDKWSHNALFSTIFALVVMVLIQCVVMWINAGSFGGMFGKMGMAWLNILRNNAYQGVIALGMCFIIISGGIDLSVGSMLCALGAILMYLIAPTGLLASIGLTGPVAYIIAVILILIVGYFFGEINGALVSYGKLPPFIATLGTMTLYSGIGMALTGGRSVVGFPDSFTAGGIATIGGLPLIFIAFVLILSVMALILERTGEGRQLYLFGGNPVASLFSGINNARMNLATFTAIGFLAGLAGLTIIMRVNSAKVGYGDAYVFQSLIVCVIAGIHPAGGRGKVIGIGLTVILMQMAASSFTILQLSPYTTKLIWGLMLILVLGLTKDGRRLLELIRSSFKKPSAKPLAKREES